MRLQLLNRKREAVAASEDPRAIKSAARLLGLETLGNVVHVIDLSIYGDTMPVLREVSPDILAALGL